MNEVTSEVVEIKGEFQCKFAISGNDCEGPIVGTCVICRQPFCKKHQSEADTDSCMTCVDYQTIELKREPLVDEEGVTHEGAKITPIGLTYRTLTTRISQMTDNQLESHIDFVRKQVKEAEMVLDYRRIDLAASQNEFEERGIAKRKNLRMKSVATIANGNKVIEAPTSPASKAKDKALKDTASKLLMIAKLLGLPCNSPQDIANLAIKLKAMNAPKKDGVA